MPQLAIANVSIINASTVLTDIEIRPVLEALQKQVSNDFRPALGVDAKLNFAPRNFHTTGAYLVARHSRRCGSSGRARLSRPYSRRSAHWKGLCRNRPEIRLHPFGHGQP